MPPRACSVLPYPIVFVVWFLFQRSVQISLFFWFRGMPSDSRKLCLDELTSPGVSLGEQLRLVGIGNAPLPRFWTNLTRIFHLELPWRIKLNFSLPGITRLVFSPSLSCFSHSYRFLLAALFDEVTCTHVISRSASGKPDPRHHLSTFYSSLAAYLISVDCFPELGPGPYSFYR